MSYFFIHIITITFLKTVAVGKYIVVHYQVLSGYILVHDNKPVLYLRNPHLLSKILVLVLYIHRVAGITEPLTV